LKLNSTEITPSSTRRLTELEMQLSKIDDNIAIEEFKAKNKLTKKKIIEYLKQSSHFNIQKIIFRYIDKIILFGDKVEIYYNFKKKENPDDNHRDYSYSDGSNKSLMVPLVGTLRGLPFPFREPSARFPCGNANQILPFLIFATVQIILFTL